MLLFWASLLPVLAVFALVDFELHAALSRAYMAFAYPYIMALVAAAGASVLVGVFRHGTEKDSSAPGEDILLFASFTALLLMLSYESLESSSLAPACTNAIYMWLSYGLGVVVFWSIGQKLRHQGQSQARSVVMLFCILAIVGATLAGFSEMKF
jgi:hypothetical protein